MSNAASIARHLLNIKAVKLRPDDPFTWASGMRSPIYCDNRITLSYPAIRKDIQKAFVDLAKSFEGITMIAGVATAGIAHGALLADALDLPYIYVRSSNKSHGRQNQIEGELFPDANILVIEDLISTGGSAIQAVEVLRAAGAQVAGVLAIFNYGFQKAIDNFQRANCTLQTISSYPILLEEAKAMDYISADHLETLKAWSASPETWFQSNSSSK
jgi:orotate phosphoribosyltransferase